MTVNLNTLSESILRETDDARYTREIEENREEIVQQLQETGVYDNPASGLHISVSHP